ncbi:response regulator transcription factor [Actinomycetospora chibensis]|uniref:Response regulator n=1 Tax=Actinomycetospora chibensis TaxID=663606 RepID=A0ABV9RI70_9PSEU|nr:response regulator transcription factor [Actinomycetospora chibensis]MDD7927630.1 response regulator transcription factor [Actinomycetospora chibensis]
MSAPTEITEVLVVDDHEVVRAGVAAALSRDERMTVVASAGDGREALALCCERRPDVAVIDMRLPDMAGHELCRRIREQCPDTAVVVLSTYLSEEAVRDCVVAGAAAYVTKAAGLTELRTAIVDAHHRADPGHRPCVSQIVRRLEQLVTDRGDSDAPTPAQSRVLALAAQGLTYGQIARDLRISESTVRFHIQKLKVKLGVRSRSELAVAAVRAGLVEEGAGAAR